MAIQRKPTQLKANRPSARVEKLPKYWVFGEVACFGAFLKGFRSGLMAGAVEIEVPIMVLLMVWHSGVPIMKSNGKSRISDVSCFGDYLSSEEGALVAARRVFICD